MPIISDIANVLLYSSNMVCNYCFDFRWQASIDKKPWYPLVNACCLPWLTIQLAQINLFSPAILD